MVATAARDAKLGEQLVRDELFDLALYRRLHAIAPPDLAATLDELIRVETRHVAFWQEFFGLPLDRLDRGRRLKLALLTAACRLLGRPAIHLVLEAIEVFGVRKYLRLWEAYRDGPLGAAVRGILEDEFKHEDAVVGGATERRINPQRIRDIFLGMNDGLVEILGAVSGFFAAFGDALTVLTAASTVAVAGALSMAAGAYVATSSEQEVQRAERGRRQFLGEPVDEESGQASALGSAWLVGLSYLVGALVPVLPVLAGARSALASLLAAGTTIIVVSLILAFLSGMDIRRRIVTNVVIIAVAVGITYAIGTLARALWGISV
jgi:VIT1/CCC1 family predicted Fe2+/Mn2+ transporter